MDDETEKQDAQQTIYRWPMIGVKEEYSSDVNPSEAESPASPDSKVEQVTKDLCKWMKNLVRAQSKCKQLSCSMPECRGRSFTGRREN